MRFPPMDYMERVIGSEDWSLIPYINERVSQKDQVVQIPYYFTANNTFRLYNDVSVPGQAPTTPNTFDIQLSYANGSIDADFDAKAASQVFAGAVQNLTDALQANFTDGFNLLMEYDSYSVRGYLLTQGYTDAEIDWMETINDATGHYDMYSMSQSVLEQWVFTSTGTNGWTAINGGMDMLTKGMELIIKNKPQLDSRVTDITPCADGSLNIVVNETEHPYAHVISTVPLGALQAINMTGLGLDYFQKQSIRSLK